MLSKVQELNGDVGVSAMYFDEIEQHIHDLIRREHWRKFVEFWKGTERTANCK